MEININEEMLERPLTNRPRLLVIGRGGTGKAHFAKRLADGYGWKHIDIDKEMSNGLENVYSIIPSEDFVVVNWTLLPGDLPFLAQTCLNKQYSILRFTTTEENIKKEMIFQEADEEYINNLNRIEAEQYALGLVNILTNVVRIRETDYYDDNGDYKNEEFVLFLDYYFKSKK
jgi:hypothetical protein